MGRWLIVLISLGFVGWILWTMPIGQRVAQQLGMRGFRKQGAPQEDREFLLRACDGDHERVRMLLDKARANQPEMTDAQAYRRAIRTHMRSKHGARVVS
jgi:hypothetical protein